MANGSAWPGQQEALATMFLQKDRDAWIEYFEGHEVCMAQLPNLAEARQHPHNLARQNFQDIDGIPQAAPQPLLSKTPARTPFGVRHKDNDREHILSRWQVIVD